MISCKNIKKYNKQNNPTETPIEPRGACFCLMKDNTMSDSEISLIYYICDVPWAYSVSLRYIDKKGVKTVEFKNKHYISKGVDSEVSPLLQLFMWQCIYEMPPPKDYLQVFECSIFDGKQKIKHIQE